jgi:hypothetical protein
MTTLAGTIINRVRDLIPDPVFSGSAPQPDADAALFRASTMYGWLDDGVKLLVGASGWTILDWYAMPMLAAQPIYSVSPLWAVIDQAYAKALRLKLEAQSQAVDIYPNREPSAQQNRAYVFRATDHIDMGFDPPPAADEPQTTLAGPITGNQVTIPLTNAAGFLPYGFALVGTELVQYQWIDGNTLMAVTRGAGATTIVAVAGATVTHCSLWVKGMRVPVAVVNSTSVVEVPLAWSATLNWYVLGNALESQQETGRADVYHKRWEGFLKGLQMGGRDPITRQPVLPEPAAAAPMPMPAAAQQQLAG